MPLNTVSSGNKLRWNGSQKPFYEIYYLKLVDPRREWSLWIRYTLLVPVSGEPGAGLWGVFQRRGQKPFALKKTIPLAEIDIFHRDRFIQIGENYLALDSCAGSLADGGRGLTWNFDFEDPTLVGGIYPAWLYSLPFPKTKYLDPRLVTHVSGNFRADESAYDLDAAVGHQGHLWGTAYADNWAWGNCTNFTEDRTAVFNGLSARVRIGSRMTPFVPFFHFLVDGKSYAANSFCHWFSNKSSHDLLNWNFEVRCKDMKFVGRITRPLDLIAGVEYTGPNGEKRYCHNTNMADLTLDVYRRHKKDFVHIKTLTAPGACAFENVELEPDPRVEFVL